MKMSYIYTFFTIYFLLSFLKLNQSIYSCFNVKNLVFRKTVHNLLQSRITVIFASPFFPLYQETCDAYFLITTSQPIVRAASALYGSFGTSSVSEGWDFWLLVIGTKEMFPPSLSSPHPQGSAWKHFKERSQEWKDTSNKPFEPWLDLF